MLPKRFGCRNSSKPTAIVGSIPRAGDCPCDHRTTIDKFGPSSFKDRYQEALRELIEAKAKGFAIKPRQISTPAPAVDLMAALKRSLVQEAPAGGNRPAKARPDRRRSALLLPISGRWPRNESGKSAIAGRCKSDEKGAPRWMVCCDGSGRKLCRTDRTCRPSSISAGLNSTLLRCAYAPTIGRHGL
jgi:hypothetical protein